MLAAAGTLALLILAAGCATGPAAIRRTTTSTAAPASTEVSTTTTDAPPSTTAAPSWPAIVVQAMAQFVPPPAGARAPIRLPAENGYVTAQTGGLGGQANVTLVVTASPEPVNSTSRSSAVAGRALASFSTTPTASTANAASQLSNARSQSIAACGGPSTPAVLPGGVAATTCPTFEGAAVDWRVGSWTLQVLTLSGTTPSTSEAGRVAGLFSPAAEPASDAGGVLSVVVPANSSVGSSDTAALEWTVGADVYQVRSSDDPDAALAVAAAMRPYPA